MAHMRLLFQSAYVGTERTMSLPSRSAEAPRQGLQCLSKGTNYVGKKRAYCCLFWVVCCAEVLDLV